MAQEVDWSFNEHGHSRVGSQAGHKNEHENNKANCACETTAQYFQPTEADASAVIAAIFEHFVGSNLEIGLRNEKPANHIAIRPEAWIRIYCSKVSIDTFALPGSFQAEVRTTNSFDQAVKQNRNVMKSDLSSDLGRMLVHK